MTTTSTTKTAATRHTNDCVRQRAKFGARSKAGDVCSCGGIDAQPPEHDAGLRDRRAWTADKQYNGELDGYPLYSPEGLAAIATDPEYQARILACVNSHDALVAALERVNEQVDLDVRHVDSDDSETVAIEVTIGWLRQVCKALKEARKEQ